ncbi:ubiquitin-conjugating enzyme E2 Q2 [Podospora australis]|uniref:Ubiquitin-conjugating enzyme E2 Q2 n=1 Tax=Podospora australis TaxID=1536484 RepID=A0AAN7AKG4_9PEZI|nr:ubiquitin-conjugating enzyme E2 Q2 [Podospora australis]
MASKKRFIADVEKTYDKARAGNIPGISRVAEGSPVGTVILTLRHEDLPEDTRIHARVNDLSEYPVSHMFTLSTDKDDSSPELVDAIGKIDYLFGMSVYEMACNVAKLLVKELEGANNDGDDEEEGDDDWDSDAENDDEILGLTAGPNPTPCLDTVSLQPNPRLLKRLRNDLRTAKGAGYKVGLFGSFAHTSISGIVSLSIRVHKLGLSDEALEAWDLTEDEYVVLLMRYSNYVPLESIEGRPASNTWINFRIGKCATKKPSEHQAIEAFVNMARSTESDDPKLPKKDTTDPAAETQRFHKMFISNSLDQYMNDQFVQLLKLRQQSGYGWEEANDVYRTLQTGPGFVAQNSLNGGGTPDVNKSGLDQRQLHAGDHLEEAQQGRELSFPLVAMQFAMRYFVKCTDYCLRCHRRLPKGFEALRPYVCDDSLCLFQYMTMGFGPSVEHEIMTEPYVVDLLVSLCYAAVQQSGYFGSALLPGKPKDSCNLPIRQVPVGLEFKVPDVFGRLSSKSVSQPLGILTGDTLTFKDALEVERLTEGQWIACQGLSGVGPVLHARVGRIDRVAAKIDIVRMACSANYVGGSIPDPQSSDFLESFTGHKKAKAGEDIADIAKDGCEVVIHPYNKHFDDFPAQSKGEVIRIILETLPPIFTIVEWLTSHPSIPIRKMDRVSPAAASLLQWIVSSNRSCIFQIDRRRFEMEDTSVKHLTRPAGTGRNREHERVRGMDEWIQFRFAQGSPDKELRFNRALSLHTNGKAVPHPTIFAWHGSRLANWHSIVRTGLDYRDTLNGRAFGHGVYFSPDLVTSHSYSQGSFKQCWPHSALKFDTCLSLNEIINAPEKFTSQKPHYVVSQLDWHQCRYLFVKPQDQDFMATNNRGQSSHEPSGLDEFIQQPPGRQVTNMQRQPVEIPVSAIPSRRALTDREVDETTRHLKRVRPFQDSDGDEPDDLDGLKDDSDAESSPIQSHAAKRRTPAPQPTNNRPLTPMSIHVPQTDFEPGTLDLSKLPRLAPPASATPVATKAISAELKKLQQVQTNTPLHELGWYINFEQIDNLFQWIVELHSFDQKLPLAQDMKNAGCKSVVLELRFPKDYPFNPPFVRVIRPYFLPFQQGGGGHVTIGGAMCMELLTSNGWLPTFSIESVLLQVRMAMCSTDPRPARLAPNYGSDYGLSEAISAYERAARMHGWTIPKDFLVTAMGN